MNKRIFIERKKEFKIENQFFLKDFQNNLNIKSLKEVNYYIVYDISNISDLLFKKSLWNIFGKKTTDIIHEKIDLKNKKYFAVEPLPLQFNPRAKAVEQMLKLYDPDNNSVVKTSELFVFNNSILTEDIKKIKNYYINRIESQEKSLDKKEVTLSKKEDTNKLITGFIKANHKKLLDIIAKHNLSIQLDDLIVIQDYFKSIKRDPNKAELMLFDIYWSDHCRHTTFNTEITNININNPNPSVNNALKNYINARKVVNNKHPITMMDVTRTLFKEMDSLNKIDDVEKSIENNACAISVEHNKKKYWINFKNETHNHPTEIEPYGGASTCLGGAIRDILANRAYCFGGIRISGSGNIHESTQNTLEGKLPQYKISKLSAKGFSDYGNQIGLTTLMVDEIYDDSYKAKHLECGAVLGLSSDENIRKEKPTVGDVVILLGGDTGIDGIGGASGSSKNLNEKSITKSSSEVQKGNAIVERDIQRLFKEDSKFLKLIKKCNDFGAGGASVAIGEIADSIDIFLDKFENKYKDILPIEIAFSESQERMAILVEPKDVEEAIKLCSKYNIKAYAVGKVTDSNKLRMFYKDQKIIDIDRSILDTNGAKKTQEVTIEKYLRKNIFESKKNFNNENLINELSLNENKIKKGLIELFDFSIGQNNVFAPLGGKKQLTQEQIALSKLPIADNNNLGVATSYGFQPFIGHEDTFLLGQYSVASAIMKLAIKNVDIKNIRLSVQEYFQKLGTLSKNWGLPLGALLGAYDVARYFETPIIGGKDSMSGTFNNINVVPTFITFAFAKTNIEKVISTEFKNQSSYLYLLKTKQEKSFSPNLESINENVKFIQENINNNNIIATSIQDNRSLITTILNMAFGNSINFKIEYENLFDKYPLDIVIQSKKELKHPNLTKLGITQDTKNTIINRKTFNIKELQILSLDEYQNTFPINNKDKLSDNFIKVSTYKTKISKTIRSKKADCNVLIPVFQGTNCEFDIKKVFEKEGAKVKLFYFNNITTDLHLTVKEFIKEIKNCDIFALAGGFSLADEPDGSAKYIASVLNIDLIKEALKEHIKNKKLIIGICNGFQALINSGLLPFNKENDKVTLTYNSTKKHIARILYTKVVSNLSPWISEKSNNKVLQIPISHGEGRFVCDEATYKKLIEKGQIFSVYSDKNGNINMSEKYNANGSYYNIEGITSEDGLILGRMGHLERIDKNLLKNVIDEQDIDLFKNGVNYIKGLKYE